MLQALPVAVNGFVIYRYVIRSGPPFKIPFLDLWQHSLADIACRLTANGLFPFGEAA
jgi:hypothetical protein